MSAFPTLEPEIKARLRRRGIDPERSYRAFQREIAERPPPALMVAIFGPDLRGHLQVLAARRRLPWAA